MVDEVSQYPKRLTKSAKDVSPLGSLTRANVAADTLPPPPRVSSTSPPTLVLLALHRRNTVCHRIHANAVLSASDPGSRPGKSHGGKHADGPDSPEKRGRRIRPPGPGSRVDERQNRIRRDGKFVTNCP